MAHQIMALLIVHISLSLPLAAARPTNFTDALSVFLISSCATCTADGNSIFCSQASSPSNFVSNATAGLTIAQKQALQNNAATSSSFCWEGTFGKMLNGNVNNGTVLGGGAGFTGVSCNLACDATNLFYRQCVLNTQMTIGLMVGGILLCLCGTTSTCFCCGCCKCCNDKVRGGGGGGAVGC